MKKNNKEILKRIIRKLIIEMRDDVPSSRNNNSNNKPGFIEIERDKEDEFEYHIQNLIDLGEPVGALSTNDIEKLEAMRENKKLYQKITDEDEVNKIYSAEYLKNKIKELVDEYLKLIPYQQNIDEELKMLDDCRYFIFGLKF